MAKRKDYGETSADRRNRLTEDPMTGEYVTPPPATNNRKSSPKSSKPMKKSSPIPNRIPKIGV